MKDVNKNNYFFCYDKSLSAWLKFEKGYSYITHAIHPCTRQDFYLYEVKSNQLYEDIKEYKTKNANLGTAQTYVYQRL